VKLVVVFEAGGVGIDLQVVAGSVMKLRRVSIFATAQLFGR
jgi:hypothetical protein